MRPIPVLALLLIVPQVVRAEEDLFANPLTLFQGALTPVLQGNERGVVETTWRGFRLRADAQQKIAEKNPSEVGIELKVAVRDAVEIPKLSDESAREVGLITRTVSFPAPTSKSPQGLRVVIRYGMKAPKKSLAAIEEVLAGIKKRFKEEPAEKSAYWDKLEDFEPGEGFRTVFFSNRDGSVTKWVAPELSARKVLRRLGDRALLWSTSSPPTTATPCVVGGLHLLVREGGKWRLVESRRFEAFGKHSAARANTDTDRRAGSHVTVTLHQGGRGLHYAQSATYLVRGNKLALALPKEKALP